MKPKTATLAWHVAHVLLALVGLVGNLAYRKSYTETNREFALRTRREG